MTRAIYIISAALVLVSCSFHSVSADLAKLFCQAGHYLHLESETCRLCGDDQYMDINNHQNYQCYWCTKLDTHHESEYVLKNCTPYANTVIRCNEVQNLKYYWRTKGDQHYHRGECKLCDPCTGKLKPHIGKDCGPTEDSICCEEDSMVVIDGKCEQPKTTTPRFTVANSTTDKGIHHYTVFQSTTFNGKDEELDNGSTNPEPWLEAEKLTIMRFALGLLGFGISLALLVVLYQMRHKIREKLCSKREDPKSGKPSEVVPFMVRK